MLRSIIGGLVGSQFKKSNPVQGGAAGAAIATAVPFIISRMSLPTMLATGVGGYFAAKYFGAKKQVESQAHDISASVGQAKDMPTPEDDDTGTIIDPPPGGATVNGMKPSSTVN